MRSPWPKALLLGGAALLCAACGESLDDVPRMSPQAVYEAANNNRARARARAREQAASSAAC